MSTGTGEATYDRINDYGAVRISLASPHDIRSWSFGEVKKPETINYRTYRPEKDGLFCERIFGPEKDWECACGKYRGMKYKGMICDRCGVKVTHSRVRRKRMGHIELAAPVVHIWFFKAMPSRLGTLLDMKTTSLEKIIYFQDYVVVDPGETPLKARQLLTEEDYRKAREQYGDGFEAGMGAEAVKKLLEKLDLVELSKKLRDELFALSQKEKPSKQKQRDLVKRLKVVEALRDSGLGGPQNKPEWMVLECIPVIPPDLRPLVLLDSGNFATSDLNDLYRRIINRNNRLKKLVDLNAPEVIIRNEKRMLQQSVDALFDNNRCKRPVLGSSNRPLKSLTDMIKGKQGRFRENLLGKRVDYSARSVIVVGPELRLHQCGLPKKIALELFQPFIIRRLKELGHADTIKSAKKMLERKAEEVWDILEEVIKNHPVLLNRAPTLHRMGIQAFEPVLIEGNAIRIHPLVCKGFNADFDGDQMAVHLPLSIEAQVEASVLMMSTNNIFSPANGQPIITPSQDIVMGCYYLTADPLAMFTGRDDERLKLKERIPPQNLKGEGMVFSSIAEVFLAYAQGKVGTHARIKVRLPIEKRVISEVRVDKEKTRVDEVSRHANALVSTTVGRVIFNDTLEPQMAFYDLALSGKHLSRIIADCYQLLGRRHTIDLLDRMKIIGFRESTRSGLSFSTDDLRTPDNKEHIIKETEKEVEKVQKQFMRGIITEGERYNKVIDAWTHARDQITKLMMHDLQHDVREGVPYLNPIFLMAHSGARGGVEQIRQLAGMRGLMAKPSGQIIETPIKANFREGLSVLEYFSSTHGARKGLADTALKTADSGYLTRKLADVAQNVVITSHDCGTTQGITKGVVYKGEEIERSLADSIRGRVSRNTITTITGDTIVKENEMITHDQARKVEQMGLDKIIVRSPMTCQASLGVCRLCYGMDLSTGNLVEEGMAVGIIAAQSIGEPGTQLTMRTFHIGGTVKRVVEESDVKAKRAGAVKFARITAVTNDEGKRVALTRNGQLTIMGPKERILDEYMVPNGAELLVEEGQQVQIGQVLCRWDPHRIPMLAERGGKIRFEDIVEGETLRKERDQQSGTERWVIAEHKGDLHPQIVIEDDRGQSLEVHYIPEKAHLGVREGQKVAAGTLLAHTPREVGGTQDITGGLPRVTEIFEARRPREPAVMAEIAGKVVLGEKKKGKRVIFVVPVDDKGVEDPDGKKEHIVPHGKHLRVHTGDYVKEGDPLVDGPLVPHDILRISGIEAVQQYLVREVQSVYRSQRVDIDDKHIEIIISQMLRKVKVETMGDTGLLPGSVIDKFAFREVNDRLRDCVKIKDPGESKFDPGKIVSREAYDEARTALNADDKKPPSHQNPQSATCSTQLLGITKAAVQSDSFISAASFQETTKVLTEAALSGKVDYLVGLKENVILGHLVPAGTGFHMHQEAEVRISPKALEELGVAAPAPAPEPAPEPAAVK
jgi:DNA-directed RNA polymerase subunit beta'